MSELPDALVQVVQALVADEDLALWFESLAESPITARKAEFQQVAARMHAAGSDRGLAQAIGLLAAPGVYEGVLEAYRELREAL